MPILSRVARRHPTQVAARVLFYALLSFGALGILYPMLLVFGQSMSNAYDLRDNALMPHYSSTATTWRSSTCSRSHRRSCTFWPAATASPAGRART